MVWPRSDPPVLAADLARRPRGRVGGRGAGLATAAPGAAGRHARRLLPPLPAVRARPRGACRRPLPALGARLRVRLRLPGLQLLLAADALPGRAVAAARRRAHRLAGPGAG